MDGDIEDVQMHARRRRFAHTRALRYVLDQVVSAPGPDTYANRDPSHYASYCLMRAQAHQPGSPSTNPTPSPPTSRARYQ